MSIQVNTFENLFRLSKAVAEKVLKSAQLAVDQRGRFLLVLCGGKTPLEMYGLLAESPYVDELDWTKVHFFGVMNAVFHRNLPIATTIRL